MDGADPQSGWRLAQSQPVLLILVAVGGALYSEDVMFHMMQRMPHQNAIWHGFVLAAAIVHSAAVSGIVASG